MIEHKIEMGRLMIRTAGNHVLAMYALGDKGVPLGTISKSYLDDHPERFPAWKALMTECALDIIESAIGVRPTMREEGPPSSWPEGCNDA